MKTSKLFLSVLFCVIFLTNVSAQTQEKKVLKVTYTANCVSDYLTELLKKQIKNPVELSKMMSLMNKYKIYNTLYQNIETNESLFVIDSIKEVDHVKAPGHSIYTYKNAEGVIFGEEMFMGKKIDFKGDTAYFNWEITNEQKEINGYKCRKAFLKDNSDVYVWFTSDLGVNIGPYIYYGLPGLVLESNSTFQSVNAVTLSYDDDKEFKERLKEVKEKIEYDKSITLEEVFAKKENFKRMVSNQQR